ncbi:MAG: hypothetical protein EOO30_12240 [Comamonadaceae bacterium]|nr:MAG: hypothetical protein EOO30_12240 [Comamonadaceae bacterium]
MDDPARGETPQDISAAWFVIPMSVVAAVLIAISAWPEEAMPRAPSAPQQQSGSPPVEPAQALAAER